MNNSPAPNKRRSNLKCWIIGILTFLLLTVIIGIISVFSWHRSEPPQELMNSNEEFFILGGLLRKTYTSFAVARQQGKNEVLLTIDPRETRALLSRALKEYYRQHKPDKAVLYADYQGDKFQIFVSQPLSGQLAVHLKTAIKISWDAQQWQVTAESPRLGWWSLPEETVENIILAALNKQVKSAPTAVRQVLANSTITPESDGSLQIVCRSPQMIMFLLQKTLLK